MIQPANLYQPLSHSAVARRRRRHHSSAVKSASLNTTCRLFLEDSRDNPWVSRVTYIGKTVAVQESAKHISYLDLEVPRHLLHAFHPAQSRVHGRRFQPGKNANSQKSERVSFVVRTRWIHCRALHQRAEDRRTRAYVGGTRKPIPLQHFRFRWRSKCVGIREELQYLSCKCGCYYRF